EAQGASVQDAAVGLGSFRQPVDVKAAAVSQKGQQLLDANLAGHKAPAVLGEHSDLKEHFEQLASQHKSPRTPLGTGLGQQADLFVLQQQRVQTLSDVLAVILAAIRHQD